ncbi:MAG TPA: electron transport complex subunit E [bacterium]|nr:electron transport complex subunit E [bacterium]HPN35371.1 electron transport complex subunit E [bacterium]
MSSAKKTAGSVFKNGLIVENPTLRMLLGMCPTLAVSTSAVNAVGMGLSATLVLILSNVVISLLRKMIPEKLRIPGYIVVIATFVTMTDLALHAFFPDIHKALGIFIPLIVVNCIILGRAEAFAGKNPVLLSAVDGLAMGLGFTSGLLILGMVREILGNGTFFGLQVLSASFPQVIVMILPAGAFITLGLTIAAANWIESRRKNA